MCMVSPNTLPTKSHPKNQPKKKKGNEGRKNYLHELMDMTANHLVGRCARNLLHFPKGKEFIDTIHGCLCIRPDARTDFLLPLASYLQPFKRMSYLLNRNGWRGLLTVQLQNRSGRTPFHHLFIFLLLSLLVRKPQLLLSDTRERFILLLLDLLIHLLVELGRHLYTKENKKLKKRREEKVERKSVLDAKATYVFSLLDQRC